ncbi:MAG: hypothetical protein CMN55_10660 [Sneathiella sp.]|jgi:hypothetical protein|nr:hypothetical protein [Sneathiella sp.]|tara:strand:+ start:270 stop:482 length:213 start_codon:yes stop_codon:yes gene_type:complete
MSDCEEDMSKTEALILTKKERQKIIDRFKRYNLFGNLPHVHVKGIDGWPPAEQADEEVTPASKTAAKNKE